MKYWLVKTEPEEYSFADLLKDKKSVWDGVRNYQARNNLKLMKDGDLVFIYHTGKNKEIVGFAKVIKEHYPDPKDKTGDWFVVELEALKEIILPISLNKIKTSRELSNIPLLKQSRLSVMPVTKDEFEFILALGNTKF